MPRVRPDLQMLRSGRQGRGIGALKKLRRLSIHEDPKHVVELSRFADLPIEELELLGGILDKAADLQKLTKLKKLRFTMNYDEKSYPKILQWTPKVEYPGILK